MSAAIVIAAAALLLSLGAIVWRDGVRAGKTDTAIELLTQLVDRHDERLLNVERMLWGAEPPAATRRNSQRPHGRPGQ